MFIQEFVIQIQHTVGAASMRKGRFGDAGLGESVRRFTQLHLTTPAWPKCAQNLVIFTFYDQ